MGRFPDFLIHINYKFNIAVYITAIPTPQEDTLSITTFLLHEWLQDAERDFVGYIILTLVFLVISVYIPQTDIHTKGWLYVCRTLKYSHYLHWAKCFVLTRLGYPHKLIILQPV